MTTLLPGEACLFCRERINPLVIAVESKSPAERRRLADERYAPELDTDNPAVVMFTTTVAAKGVSELLHRITGFMGTDRTSSEVLLRLHQTELRTNRTPPGRECLCFQRSLWGRGDTRDYLGQVWARD